MTPNHRKNSLQRWRVLLITFDLTQTKPGDRRYRDADDAMSNYGTLFRPVKQVRFLLTRQSSQTIRNSIEQHTGRITLMIAPFTRAFQLSVRGKRKREEMDRFLAAARDVGLDTGGFGHF